MKSARLETPVRFEWIREQGHRLDTKPYVLGAYQTRELLSRLSVPTYALSKLTAGHDGGIYNGPVFRRVYVMDREHGVPFLGSADMLEWDLTRLPLLRRTDAESGRLSYLRLKPGITLISCSGTVGRVCYVRPNMTDFWSSQDNIKVVPQQDIIPSGYLNAFLNSKYGVPLITSSTFGTGIRHLEPVHIANLPVPRFDANTEDRIHTLIQEAANLRVSFQAGIVAATEDLFASAGLPELIDPRWHQQPHDTGFGVRAINSTTLRALNFIPRAQRLLDALRSVPHLTLGDICAGGALRTGARFKRIDAAPGHGVRLIGQRQAFWMRPSGRWISPQHAPRDIYVKDETVLIAAHGTLGENEVYARSLLVTGSWLDHTYSQDFVRVLSGTNDYPGAFLFAFLRSEAAFRLLRSMSVGGKQQEYHPKLIHKLPVPACNTQDRERIAETVRQAYRDRDESDIKEDEALRLLDEAVREAAR